MLSFHLYSIRFPNVWRTIYGVGMYYTNIVPYVIFVYKKKIIIIFCRALDETYSTYIIKSIEFLIKRNKNSYRPKLTISYKLFIKKYGKINKKKINFLVVSTYPVFILKSCCLKLLLFRLTESLITWKNTVTYKINAHLLIFSESKTLVKWDFLVIAILFPQSK